MNPLTNTTQERTGTVSVSRVNDLLKQNKKQEVLSQELQINSWNTRSTFSQMLSEVLGDLNLARVMVMCRLVVTYSATSPQLCRTEPANRPSGPANFALGSASSQLQEVLVTDLPRSFNRGERERERERNQRGRRERWKREGGGRKGGRIGKKRTGFSTFTAALKWPQR